MVFEVSKSINTIGEVVNISTQKEISIGELAQELINQINPEAKIICEDERIRPEKSEVNRLLGNNSKILKLTNWKPEYSLKNGLKETIDWTKVNLTKFKTDIYNV